MSFKEDEFDELIKAFKEKRWDDLREMLKYCDPESIKAAERYLGIKFATSFPIRIGVGQGKMKKYTKPHSKKWFSKKINQAKTKEEKQFLKASKAARLAELRQAKQKNRVQKTQSRIQKQRKLQITKLVREREGLKRQARRYGVKSPRRAYLPVKKYKYTSSRIKVLKKSNKILKKSLKLGKRKK